LENVKTKRRKSRSLQLSQMSFDIRNASHINSKLTLKQKTGEKKNQMNSKNGEENKNTLERRKL
jgi:hypothetical protein